MCDQFLHCPHCGAELSATCSIAGDNATGFFVEFFLVPADTSVGAAFVDAGIAPEGADVVSRLTGTDVSAGASFPTERGFDDDEAPAPEGAMGLGGSGQHRRYGR